MLKRIKSLMISTLMAAVFPTFRITENDNPNNNPDSPQQGMQPEQRIKELEKMLSGAAVELEQAKEKIAGMGKESIVTAERLVQLEGNLKETVTGYKALILHSNPELLPELINGDTMEALDNSLAKAKDLTSRIKENLKLQNSNLRIPAGAPARGREDTGGLSSREKIREGIARKF